MRYRAGFAIGISPPDLIPARDINERRMDVEGQRILPVAPLSLK